MIYLGFRDFKDIFYVIDWVFIKLWCFEEIVFELLYMNFGLELRDEDWSMVDYIGC